MIKNELKLKEKVYVFIHFNLCKKTRMFFNYEEGSKKVKKIGLKVLQFVAMCMLVSPSFQSIIHLADRDVIADTVANTEKKVYLDEDYAKIEGKYVEKEDTLEWTLEFEKKKVTMKGGSVLPSIPLQLVLAQ